MKDMKKIIQERHRKPIEEFVQRALKEYKNEIDSITLFGSVARGEARVPFLDFKLVEYVAKLPLDKKLKWYDKSNS